MLYYYIIGANCMFGSGRKYERLQQVVNDTVGKQLSSGEHIEAWSFVQSSMTPQVSVPFVVRQFILAATNKQLFLIQLDMKSSYKSVGCKAYPLSKVHVYRIK